MSNWLHKTKTSPRHVNKFEFDQRGIIDRVMFHEAHKTVSKKKRHFYKMTIESCGKCLAKFRMNKELRIWCEKNNKDKVCPSCRGETGKGYLYISKREKEAIKRLMEAQGCTVRKMTLEERNKYIK